MRKKENAQPHKNAELSASKNSSHLTCTKPMTARQERVLQALMDTASWVSRETVDSVAGSSNGPDVIRRLRQRLGHDSIEMERVSMVDRDGLPAKPGRYRLTAAGRQRVAEKGSV